MAMTIPMVMVMAVPIAIVGTHSVTSLEFP